MESTDSYSTPKSNDPYEEVEDDTNEAGDDDLCPEWPDGGMVCPVTGCGTKFYVNLTTYWGHWKSKHHEQLRQLYCPECPHKSVNKKCFATHLTKKHRIKMSDLDQVIASVHTELIPNKEFIPPGTQRCPKRKSVSSKYQMGPKRQRMKSPSQDGQCKQDEDNSSVTDAETDVKVSICNVAKDVSSADEIERLPITQLSETGQKEGSDKNGSHANETSRNDISHSHQSKKVTVCPPTEAQNISVSDAESERGISDSSSIIEMDKEKSDSSSIIEMDKEKSEAAQFPDRGWHEGGMRCHVPACGSQHFDTLNSYQAHWKQVHCDTIKEFKCPLCSFKQSEKLQLQRHLRLKHKVDKTALQAMLSIVKAKVLPNQQYIDPGTVQCPKGEVYDLSGSVGKTKRTRLSAAQGSEMKHTTCGEKPSTQQTDFIDPAVGGKSLSAHSIRSDNKQHADDFGFQDKGILQDGLKVDTAAAISNEDNVSVDTVKQVVAVLEREETEINESVSKIKKSAVEMKIKVADVDKVTVESEKAIDTQVLECVSKVTETESAVEMKRKVADVDKDSVESKKAIDTQVLECVTKVTETESAVEMKRKVADVDQVTVESEKAIDTQVLECVTNVTETESAVEMKRKVADVDKVTVESEKAIDTQVLECVTEAESAVEMKRKVADVDQVTVESEKAIDTQVLECVTKVTETESAVEMKRKVADVDKVTVESEKAIDTQVLECVTKVTETESAVEMKRKVADVDKVTVESEKAIDTQVLECVTKVTETESAVEMKRKVADVDQVTVESEKAIDTQVLECVTEAESAVEMKRKVADVDKVTVESEKAIDTQVLECVTKVTETESAVEMKRKVADVDKGTVESEKAIDTQVLECITKVTETESAVEMKRKVADVDKVTVESEKAIDTQVLECVTKVTETESAVEMKRKVADVDKGSVESEKAIDTQVLECVIETESAVEMKRKGTLESEKTSDTQVSESFTNVTESAVEMKRKVADVDKGSVEKDKAIDTQVSLCVHTSDIKMKRAVDSKMSLKVSEAARKIETKTDSASNIHDIPSDRIRKETDKSITEIPESFCIRIRKSDDEEKINPPVETETVNDKERYGIYISYDTVIGKGDDKSEYDDDDKSVYNNEDKSVYNNEDKSGYNDDDKSVYNNEDQSGYHESDRDLTMTDDSELDEAKEAEDLDTVVRPIFLDGQMLCPGSGCLDQVYDSLKAFYKHWQAEHQLSVQRFECPSCSFKDVRKMEIRRHLKKDHNVRQRYVLEELMSLIKLESTPKTAEDSKPETSSKRKSTCQLKAKIKKQKMSFESDADEREDGKEKKVSSSKKREGVVSMPDWVESGMPCPVRECGDHHYTSHGSFISHWKKKHTNLSVKFECPDCSIHHFDKMNLKRHLQYRHHYQGEKLEVKMTKIKSTIVDNGGFSDTRVQKGAKVKDVLLKEKSYKREKLRDKDKTEKDTKDEGPKEEDSIKVEIQVSGESNEKLSPKKEKVVWFFGMTCPVKNCGPRNFVSPREFHNHWENVHHPYIKKFECPICQYKNTQREVVGNHLRLSHNAVKTNDVRDLSQIKMVDVSNPMFKDPGRFYFRDVSSMPSRNPDVKTAATTSPVQAGTDGIHELKEAEDTITQASEKISKDPIPVKWVSGMSCPVMNCGASYFMTILSFRSHWENIHNINILKFKCPLCTFTNITKANIIAHLSVQHKMSDAMVKAKVNQIQNVKVKNNRYIDPGFYCFSEMEEVKQFQTDINTSLSEKKDIDLGADLKGKIEKAGKISWMVGMCCPVKACGSETYLTLDSFSSHWIKTHHLELNMFQCSQCTFRAIQKSEIENHLKSHHWILAEKDVKTALSKLQVVKVLNPAFKDTEGYQFGPPGTEEEGECSLSNSENKPSEQASKEMDLGADLKGKIEKAGKITWMIGMCCPVKACGSETYLTLDSFSNHWIKTHHSVLNMFQCSQCTFRAIQKSEIENHLKSHHWILAEKDVKTALTKVQVVKVLNPAFKDTEGYHFGPPDTEVEGECSLSNSENKPSEQASKDTIDALVESTIKSPSENEELGLKSSSSKSAAEEKEPVKVVFVSNMSCPVDKCGTHTFASLSSFEDHWTKRHLPVRDHFKCKICKIGNIVRMSTYRHIKDVHGIKYFAIEKYIYTVSDTNSQFLDPGPFYFEKCSELAEIAKNTIAAKSASGIQKKEKTKSKSTSQKERRKIAVEWKYNMTCPVCKCDLKIYNSWTSYCQHWEMAHEQRYLQVPACPECSFQSGQRSHLIHHMKQRHNLVAKELDRAVEEIRFVDVENPSFVDPGNYTCIWFGKCSENEKSSTTASSGNGKTESESRSEEEMPKIVVEWENNLTCPSQNKKFKFTPGMPCPVKNCSPVQISSYSAFVQHWNEHALMLKKFACTLCDFKHIQKSIVFMHVRKEHGMPSHVVTNKITTVMETNVKAEELYVPELPTDHRRSIIMVKPDDSGQLNTCDTNGGKIKEATDVVEELKKSDENIGMVNEQKEESKEESEKDESEKEESKGQMHEDAWTGLGDEKKTLESTQLADVNRENVLTNNTAQRVYKSSDEDIKLRMSENQEKKEVSLQKKATELAERKQWYPKKLKFAPGMPCPAKNCRHFHFASYSAFVQHWNEQHARMQTKFACTICDFKHIERPIVFLHVRKEHDMPSHVVKKKITKVKETNVKAEELYVPEMTDHRRSIIMVKPDDSEVNLQKNATEPIEMEERYPKKSKFAPGMPCPVKNCSPVHMQEKFACTICDFKDIHRSNVFMHVRKEHGVPSHVGKKIITKLKETNVKAEELYFPEMPKDRRRSIIMVKPDDSEVSLQKKATESTEKEERYPKKPKFAPGMPCPAKNCRHFHFASYSAFVQHWNERHARMQTMFACTMCDLKHIERSIVFMHVRKEHGMPFQVIKKKITKVKETNVKAEELYVPEMTDHRRSIIMVKPDDSGQLNTCDTNGGKIKEATDVVQELKKSDENIGMVNEQKEESKGRRDEKKPLESTQPADVNRENVLTNNTAQRVYKSSDEDIKLRMSENQEKKEASVQKKATKPAQKEQRYPKKLKFAPGMPCPVKNCSTARISSYSLLEHHWNEQHGLMLKKFACTVCDFKNNQKSIVFMHVRKEHGIPSHVAAAKITMVTESNSQYVDADELYFPEFPAEDRKLIFMIKPDDSETGVFGEVLPDSSAEQPTLKEKVQMEAKQLVSPKDEEDMIEKEEHSVKGKVESSKDEVKTVMPSGSSDVPKSLVDDEDLISDFKDDSLVIDMSQFICIDEIGDEDAEVNEESSEKQSAKETVLPGDQEYEIQDEISSPTKDDKIEDILQNFVCIDDIGDEEGS